MVSRVVWLWRQSVYVRSKNATKHCSSAIIFLLPPVGRRLMYGIQRLHRVDVISSVGLWPGARGLRLSSVAAISVVLCVLL